MIEVPAGWQARFGANLAILYPPGGGGRVRYQERLPLRSFAAVVDERLADDPEFRAGPVVREIGRQTTVEGEHAAWVTIPGTRRGARAAHFIGAVVLDETTATLDTLALDPRRFDELETATRGLLGGLTFGLGVRRRHFYHDLPADWHALPSGLTTIWYPLDFPRRRATLTVLPATPVTPGSDDGHERFLQADRRRGVSFEGPVRVEPFRAASGLTGHGFAVVGVRATSERIHKEIVVLVRDPYRYTLIMESDDRGHEAARALLHRVAASVEPVPAARHRPLDGDAGEAAAALGETWRD